MSPAQLKPFKAVPDSQRLKALRWDFKLTESQAAFVFWKARGKSNRMSATLAGYGTPNTEGSRLLKDPAVLAALSAELSRVMVTDLAPLGVQTLRRAMREEGVPWPVKIQAAKIAVSALPKAPESKDDKPLSQRSAAELEEIIARLERTTAPDAARLIEHEPGNALGL
jgi:hypothetical protein